MQLVHIVEGGERAQMSKRRGEFVSLDELIDDIGVDAARFFMLQRSHDTTVDLDLELARAQSQDNPVYYVQYAHARIASILRKAVAEGARRRPRRPLTRRWSTPRGRARAPRRADRAGAGQAPARASPTRSARPPSAARRTGSAPTRPRSPPTSTPSTATARWSGRRGRGSRRPRLALCLAAQADDRPDPGSARASAPPSGCRRAASAAFGRQRSRSFGATARFDGRRC